MNTDLTQLRERSATALACLPLATFRQMLGDLHEEFLDTIDRLTAERDALAKDAARWKMYCTGTIYAEWDFNEEDGTLSHIYLATLGGDKRDGQYFATLAQFEADIDAAIAKE